MNGKACGEQECIWFAETGYSSGFCTICSRNVKGLWAVMRIVKGSFTLDKRLLQCPFYG